jgi:probable rRNA maturation factor
VIRVHISWERKPSTPAAKALRRAICETLRRQSVNHCEVHVLLTGDRQIRELNRQYRGHDCATDVLAFTDGEMMPDGTRLLGEVILSVDTARRQALRLGHTELRELEELVIHGTLHLLGYDHNRDRGEMETLELGLREKLLS